MKGTEAWEQHGEASREEAGSGHSCTSLKLGYLLAAGMEEPWSRRRGAVLND